MLMRMKKILYLLLSAMFMMTTLTSCVTATAATDDVVVATNGEELYVDVEWDYVIVYIDNIPNYRFWDYRLSRYWYRPVPYDRFRYIHRAPASHRFHNVPMHRHRSWSHHNSGPMNRHHYDARPHRPNNNGNIHRPGNSTIHRPNMNHRPGNSSHQPRIGHSSSTRVTGPSSHHHSSNNGRFGGRR